jgi:hypothetical protein
MRRYPRMKVYVIHCTEKGRIPRLTPEQAQSLKEALGKALAAIPGVRYNGTMYEPQTGIGVCDWDAPSPQTVEDILRQLGIPYDAVVAVQPLVL